ncbi:MAG: cupin domain-containing protein [Planctomycetota bacterium]|jgi:quercetin dioxygenase-like cupin family protein
MGVIHRKLKGYNWSGVPIEQYDQGGAVKATKRVLIGTREGAKNFEVRYFEVEPGERTSLDRHQHEHGVYILRGCARLLMDKHVVEVESGDVVYIPPNEVHQFESIGEEPLGFLCVVPPRD